MTPKESLLPPDSLAQRVINKPRITIFTDVHGGSEFSAISGVGPLDVYGVNKDIDTHFVFLGDVPDKGPRTRQVFEELIRLDAMGRLTSVMGNHDAIFASLVMSMTGGVQDLPLLNAFLKSGGIQTLQSYGVGVESILGQIKEYIAPTEYFEGNPYYGYQSLKKPLKESTFDDNFLEHTWKRLSTSFGAREDVRLHSNFITSKFQPYVIANGVLGVHAGVPIDDSGIPLAISMADFMEDHSGKWSDKSLQGLDFLDELGNHFIDVDVLRRIALKKRGENGKKIDDSLNPMRCERYYRYIDPSTNAGRAREEVLMHHLSKQVRKRKSNLQAYAVGHYDRPGHPSDRSVYCLDNKRGTPVNTIESSATKDPFGGNIFSHKHVSRI